MTSDPIKAMLHLAAEVTGFGDNELTWMPQKDGTGYILSTVTKGHGGPVKRGKRWGLERGAFFSEVLEAVCRKSGLSWGECNWPHGITGASPTGTVAQLTGMLEELMMEVQSGDTKGMVDVFQRVRFVDLQLTGWEVILERMTEREQTLGEAVGMRVWSVPRPLCREPCDKQCPLFKFGRRKCTSPEGLWWKLIFAGPDDDVEGTTVRKIVDELRVEGERMRKDVRA